MLQKLFKMIPLVMASTIVITLVSVSPCLAASKKPKLVSSVTVQEYDTTTKKWQARGSYDYTYNKKGDPIKIEYSDSRYGYYTKTLKYHYRKNGKHKYTTYKRTGRMWSGFNGIGRYKDFTGKGKIIYNKRGHRTKEKYKESEYNDNGVKTGGDTATIKYKHKKYLFYLSGDDLKEELEDGGKTKVVIRKKGIIKKVKTGYKGEAKWHTSHTFLKNGLIKKSHDTKYKYKYYKGTGLVKSVKYYYDYGGIKMRYVFHYSKKSIRKTRYNAMINSFFSSFIWY